MYEDPLKLCVQINLKNKSSIFFPSITTGNWMFNVVSSNYSSFLPKEYTLCLRSSHSSLTTCLILDLVSITLSLKQKTCYPRSWSCLQSSLLYSCICLHHLTRASLPLPFQAMKTPSLFLNTWHYLFLFFLKYKSQPLKVCPPCHRTLCSTTISSYLKELK